MKNEKEEIKRCGTVVSPIMSEEVVEAEGRIIIAEMEQLLTATDRKTVH